ncbi:MAG: hypothetical protein K5831_16040 [Brevundimonas sp.]|uniref:hypothetical protein n=1 Tax=Brevundimonas sp. TaxID=1871086 RepID=UPI0025857183|nr:hypothetical protein [Brevundimonas sp.]MCV0416377.1 hypothetical protein [Brevundimonas sp.]
MTTPSLAIPRTPHLPEAAVARLRGLLDGCRGYLEYGSGGSTVMAGEMRAPFTVSVESDGDWLAALRQALDGAAGERILLYADIGPTGEWGHPVSEAQWRSWHAYPLLGWETCRARGLVPDLVLIDGRFRRACLYASLLFAWPGTRILFDDYAGRPTYHPVEEILKPVALHDRMAEFVAPASIDRDVVWRALLEASTDKA